MNPTDPNKDFPIDVEKYAVTPDFLEGVDLGPSTLEAHLATPEVSYEQYRHQKEFECGERVVNRKSIYLDTRFWIHLRDADLGKSVPAVYDRLLMALRKGVSEGKLICPFAADMLAEVYKQSDRTTRLATARLIDELSLNIALQSEPERLAIELHHGIQAVRSSAPPQEPLRMLVWTCSSFAVGHAMPSSPGFDQATELALQKSFLDTICRLGFSHQLLGEEEDNYQPGDFNRMWDELAERLNNLNAEDAKEEKLRKQIEMEEFSGALEAYLPVLRNFIRHILISALNEQPYHPAEAEIDKATSQIGGMICEAFRLGRLKNNFPTFAIRAALATAVRWDRKRKYKRNDFHDFGHAAAALPYFDIFATEKSLHHLLVTDLKFDARFATAIECEPEALLSQLIKI
jgi:hypothetical protein